MSAAPLRTLARGGLTLVWVRAQPGARRSGIAGLWQDHLKIAVRAPAHEGRANEELCTVLADALELPRARVALERGARARLKLVCIALDEQSVRARLLRALGDA